MTIALTKRHYRVLTAKDKLKIIALRYGTLTDFGEPVTSVYKIAKDMRMPYDTARRTCLKFVAVGKSLDALITKKPREFKIIPAVIKKALLSQ